MNITESNRLKSKAIAEIRKNNNSHQRVITKEDITNLKILLHTSTVEDFLKRLEPYETS